MKRNLPKILSSICDIKSGKIRETAVFPSFIANTALSLSLIFLLSISSAHAEWVEYINDASVGFTYNDNLNQSSFPSDEETDSYITPAYTFGRFYQANDLTRLRFSLDLTADIHDEFNKLDSLDLIGNATVIHKFGIGPKKPWMRGNISLGRKDAELDIRDSKLQGVGLGAGKRFTERLSGQIGLNYNHRDGGAGQVIVEGKSSEVFDIENKSISMNVDYLLDQRSQISASLTHRDGEFDSACTTGNVGIVLDVEDVKAITGDEVFGGCVYRLDGSSNSARVQYSYALGRHSSLNVSYEKREGKADVLEYDTSLWNISLMYSQ